ncbi:unnamed protein product [Brassica rapa]|uniref:Uncharacterized protein n=1 Tax=Brassica campestris TaxID=3711 RepID=A0A8D9DCF9_BRACM|nr:unnamed protein product [Brassica rapa]
MAYPSTTHPTTARPYTSHVTIVHQSAAHPTTSHPTTTHPSTGHQPQLSYPHVTSPELNHLSMGFVGGGGRRTKKPKNRTNLETGCLEDYEENQKFPCIIHETRTKNLTEC